MMEFLATNFNLPTIIVGAIVFGGVGWATWHSHKLAAVGAAAKAAAMAIAAAAAAATDR